MSELDESRFLITPIPERPEDLALINEWIAARSGMKPEPLTDYMIYHHDGNTPPAKDWTKATCRIAKMKLRHLACRVPMPLLRLGLTDEGGFTKGSLRAPVIAYARDYEIRHRGHAETLLKQMGREAGRLKGPVIWRTKSWWYLVTHSREFYNWLERHGRRPKGSNPFKDISRPRPVVIGRTLIVESWFRRMLETPMKPKEEALLHLMANGLRADEIINLTLEDIQWTVGPSGALHVLGKGSKLRVVPLYRRTRQALDRWLAKRAADTRRLIFPGNRDGRGRNSGKMNQNLPRTIVTRIATRVFDDPIIIARMTPHKFRHFFVSDWMQRGGAPQHCQAIVGHTSLQTLEKYRHTDPRWVADAVRQMDRDLSEEERHAEVGDVVLSDRVESHTEPIDINAKRGAPLRATTDAPDTPVNRPVRQAR